MRFDPLLELKDKILSLSVSHPQACFFAIKRIMRNPIGLKNLAFTFYMIGFEYSKYLFDQISETQWSFFEKVFYSNSDTIDATQQEKILREVYSQLLSEVMVRKNAHLETEDPFQFLRTLSLDHLKDILTNVDSAKIALIAVFWHDSDMLRIIQALTQDKKRELVLQINRLSRLPEEFAIQASTSFAKELELFLSYLPLTKDRDDSSENTSLSQEQNRIDVSENPEVIAAIKRITSRVSTEEENKIIHFIRTESPELSDALRLAEFRPTSPQQIEK